MSSVDSFGDLPPFHQLPDTPPITFEQLERVRGALAAIQEARLGAQSQIDIMALTGLLQAAQDGRVATAQELESYAQSRLQEGVVDGLDRAIRIIRDALDDTPSS